ncbi:MAG: restriction endonuclease subunit S [Thermoguttaceae bacterium]
MSTGDGLPKGWASVPLGEIGRWFGGSTPSKANNAFWNQGEIPWISPKDMKRLRLEDSQDHISSLALQETNIQRFPAGTVLIVIRSGILARTLPVAVAKVTATINQDLKGISPFLGIDSDYVAYYLISAERALLHSCAKDGTTVASIEIDLLRRQQVPLAPCPEQRRIVAKIDELFSDLDAGVAALVRAKAKLKRYRAAVLKAAVEGKLTEEWRKKNRPQESGQQLLDRILRERRRKWEEEQLAAYEKAGKNPPANWKKKYKEPVGPDNTTLPTLPEDWCWATVEQAAVLVTDGDHNPPKRVEDGVPHLTAKHIKQHNLVLNGCTFISEADFERSRSRYEPVARDVIVTCVGTVGEVAVVPEDVVFSADRNLAAARLIPGGLRPFMLQYILTSPSWRQRIATASGSTAQPHLYLGDLRALPLPVAPLDEQDSLILEIERRLSLAQEAESQIAADLKRSNRLRQSILKRAFHGKLVPQDPKDEPASVLLARIQAERSDGSRSPAAVRRRSAQAASSEKPRERGSASQRGRRRG